ncbi:DMT family transporter [Endozoicomonas lisbonensis]|uniref:Drug/metabolite transporter (DMT)-like permease n=1 Tax=Endozoicomonas lisbonensis TaxID=3120522 RepID=A0ABV2SHT9_9GAMM
MNTVSLFLLCSLIWGSTWFAITFQLGVNSLWSVFYRFLLAGVMLAVYCCLRTGFPRFTVSQHIRLFIQGACLCGLSYWLIYESERYITSGLSAVLCTSVLYFNIMIRCLWLAKPVETKVVAGGVLGSLGVLLVMLPELDVQSVVDAAGWGMLIAVLGSLVLAFGCVACERNEEENLPILPTITLNMLYGSATVALIALVQGVMPEFNFSSTYIGSLVYLAVFGSVGALSSYVVLIRRIGADRAAFIDVVYPVIALCLSSLVEGYQWSLMALLGVTFIGVGNTVALKPSKTTSGEGLSGNQG